VDIAGLIEEPVDNYVGTLSVTIGNGRDTYNNGVESHRKLVNVKALERDVGKLS
jgi:hypothetical protein